MPISPFIPDVPTLGQEAELFVVDAVTYKLQPLDDLQFAEIKSKIGPAWVAPEYKACQIELRTGVHRSVEELRNQQLALRHEAASIIRPWGLKLLANSTHAFSNWRQVAARSGERYRWIESKKGDNVNRLCVSGEHVHVGTFHDDATRVDRLRRYRLLVPLTLAATAASPMYAGRYTGQQSYRRSILTNLANQVPIAFGSLEEYRDHISALTEMNVIEQPTDIWGDVRLGNGNKPTVEMRCMETSSNIDDGPAIAALLQAFEFDLRMDRRPPPPMGELAHARLDASCRQVAAFGGEALIWDFEENRACPAQEVAERLVARLAPAIDVLDLGPWIERFLEMIRGDTSAARMLSTLGTTHSRAGELPPETAVAIVRAEVDRTAAGPSIHWPPVAFEHLLAA